MDANNKNIARLRRLAKIRAKVTSVHLATIVIVIMMVFGAIMKVACQ